MRNVSDKSCKEIQNTHFVFSNLFLNRAVYEIMWKNIAERGRYQTTIWRMCIASCNPKTTNTHSDCVILIVFPLQQWLHERASMLRHTYIVCLLLSRPVTITNLWIAPTGFRFLAGLKDFPLIQNFQWSLWGQTGTSSEYRGV